MMRKIVLSVLLIAIAVALVLSCTFQVKETEFAIVSRFGNPTREVREAGLQFKFPPPIDGIVKVDRRLNVLDPDPAEFLTLDKKNILVNCFLTWSVQDPTTFLLSVTEKERAEVLLTDILSSEVGAALGAHPMSALVSHEPGSQRMDDVMESVTALAAKKALENYGIQVSSVRVKRLNFPSSNKQAVFRRMEAERERIATLYRSEGQEEADKIRAQANREQARLTNEAKRKAEATRGLGDAEAIRILNEAHGQDPEFYEFQRSLEALENTVRDNSTFVVPSDWKFLQILKDPGLFSVSKTPADKSKEEQD